MSSIPSALPLVDWVLWFSILCSRGTACPAGGLLIHGEELPPRQILAAPQLLETCL